MRVKHKLINKALLIRLATIFMVGVEYLHYLILTKYYWSWSFGPQGSVRRTNSPKVYAFTILIATICNLAPDTSDYALRNPEKWWDTWMALGHSWSVQWQITGVPSARLPFKGSGSSEGQDPNPLICSVTQMKHGFSWGHSRGKKQGV